MGDYQSGQEPPVRMGDKKREYAQVWQSKRSEVGELLLAAGVGVGTPFPTLLWWWPGPCYPFASGVASICFFWVLERALEAAYAYASLLRPEGGQAVSCSPLHAQLGK